jgi:hypothetical protein
MAGVSMNEGYIGDLMKTGVLYELKSVPKEQRDDKWVATFYENIADASLVTGDPQLFNGPDGFPYLSLFLPIPGKPFQSYVVRHVIEQTLKNGVGIVVEPNEKEPMWVFSYGDIVGFRTQNNWEPLVYDHTIPMGASQEVLEREENVLIGQPSEELLPQVARDTLKRFLVAQGVNDPHILLMARSSEAAQRTDLVFGLSPEEVGGEEKLHLLLRWISWFLPRGLPFCAMKRESVGNGSFLPL